MEDSKLYWCDVFFFTSKNYALVLTINLYYINQLKCHQSACSHLYTIIMRQQHTIEMMSKICKKMIQLVDFFEYSQRKRVCFPIHFIFIFNLIQFDTKNILE